MFGSGMGYSAGQTRLRARVYDPVSDRFVASWESLGNLLCQSAWIGPEWVDGRRALTRSDASGRSCLDPSGQIPKPSVARSNRAGGAHWPVPPRPSQSGWRQPAGPRSWLPLTAPAAIGAETVRLAQGRITHSRGWSRPHRSNPSARYSGSRPRVIRSAGGVGHRGRPGNCPRPGRVASPCMPACWS